MKKLINKQCKICSKQFKPINIYKGYGFYCSNKCFGISQRGRIPWNKGIKIDQDERVRKFVEAGHKSIKPPSWNKGLRYGKSNWLRINNPNLYRNIHKRITRKFGKTKQCEVCKRVDLKIYHWANKSSQYLEKREDWIRLCPTCHMRLDKPNQQGMNIL